MPRLANLNLSFGASVATTPLDLGLSMLKLMCKHDCCVSTGLSSCAQHPTTSVKHGTCQVFPKLVSVLRQYFGCEEFRPGQIDAILAVLHGHDVFVRMAGVCVSKSVIVVKLLMCLSLNVCFSFRLTLLV